MEIVNRTVLIQVKKEKASLLLRGKDQPESFLRHRRKDKRNNRPKKLNSTIKERELDP
jgi:hypothetical protein